VDPQSFGLWRILITDADATGAELRLETLKYHHYTGIGSNGKEAQKLQNDCSFSDRLSR
jgi:hypothetical protein